MAEYGNSSSGPGATGAIILALIAFFVSWIAFRYDYDCLAIFFIMFGILALNGAANKGDSDGTHV